MTDPTDPAFAGPCPRCGGGVPNSENPGAYCGATSRLDNKTYICSQCDQNEAMWEFTNASPLPPLDQPATQNS